MAENMTENESPVFVTLTGENGDEIILEYVTDVELNGVIYKAFFTTDEDDEGEGNGEDDADGGLVIMKEIIENGESILATIDDEAELNAAYDEVMQAIFGEDDEDEE